MNRVQRLAAAVAELRARKLEASAVPLATERLEAAGFTVHPFPAGDGLAVDDAPGLRTKLDEIEACGIRPALLCILRDFSTEHASGTADPAKASEGDRGGGAGEPRPVVSATPSKRVTDPTTENGRKHV